MPLTFSLVLLFIWILILMGLAAYLIADLFFDRRLVRLPNLLAANPIAARTGWSDADDRTEIGGRGLVGGYLIAEEPMSGFPLQINLYTDREIYIGRSKSNCDVALHDITISRRHARISFQNGDFLLEDLGSKGGTFVDKRRLQENRRHPLRSGEIITFYTFGYRFQLADEDTQIFNTKETLPTGT
ncbi:MAG: FHA domain-containing protein [Caldilineaceae bacterium]|nr:FHA domain-containing protein [Caldilineaceae bacterium]